MKAHDAMFLGWVAADGKPARLEIVSKTEYIAKGIYTPCDFSMGAAFFCWKDIPGSQIMSCILRTGFDIVENYGVPAKDVAKELEKVEGFIEYWNETGVMAGVQ